MMTMLTKTDPVTGHPQTVLALGFMKPGGHGESAERRSTMWNPPRHLPKFGHPRKDVVGHTRTEGRSHHIKCDRDPFTPRFMIVQPATPKRTSPKPESMRSMTIWERTLAIRAAR